MNIEDLNKERKKQKMSVADLANKANLPKGTVEKVLFGIVKHPRIDTMQAIEKALGLKPTADWTDEERAAGAAETKKISITPLEDEMLYLFREVGRKHGEQAQQALITVAEKML